MPAPEIESKSSYDPLLNAKLQNTSFDRAILKEGARFTWTQRIGSAILGLFFWGFGAFLLTTGLGAIREYFHANGLSFSIDILGYMLFVSFGLGLIILGALILKNVLTFSKKS